jgi:hypothetical protein
MVIDSAVKSKVIHLWTSGCGRNQILRELANQGVKISTTTVTNLIRQHQAHFNGPLLSYLLGDDNSTDEEEVIPPLTTCPNSPSPVVPVLQNRIEVCS